MRDTIDGINEAAWDRAMRGDDMELIDQTAPIVKYYECAECGKPYPVIGVGNILLCADCVASAAALAKAGS